MKHVKGAAPRRAARWEDRSLADRDWWARHRRILTGLLAIWIAVVVAASVYPTPAAPASVPAGTDKAAHAVLYGVLALLLRLVTARSRFPAIRAAACVGAMLELVQLHIPGRSGDWADIAWNVVGCVAGGIAAERLITAGRQQPFRHREKSQAP
ncbi:MAG TPA: VanZ family protein [Bryobacteraceae bacterium]|nr:VanZ family protein [Bryobacteraceae bacterium]